MAQLKSVAAAGKGSVTVILPDTVSSTRYVEFDAPYLKQAFTAAGLSTSDFTVENALGSDATQLSMAQSAVTKGASVLVVDPLDSGVGAHIESYAKQHGVAVIDYDRLTLGRHPLVLRLLQQRQGRPGHGPGPRVLHHGLGRQEPQRHRDEGRPDRQQRDAVRPGLRRRAWPRTSPRASGRTSASPAGTWTPSVALSEFQQQYTAHKNINAALIPNDENGAPIIHYLQGQGIKAKTFPTTGQDATLTGLQNILTGYQCGTVYKPIYLEAQAAAALALYVRAGQTPPSSLVNGSTAGHHGQRQRAFGPAEPGVGHHGQHELDGHRRQVRAGQPALRGLVRERLHGRRDLRVNRMKKAHRSFGVRATRPAPRTRSSGRM